jgi:hypothetical protein
VVTAQTISPTRLITWLAVRPGKILCELRFTALIRRQASASFPEIQESRGVLKRFLLTHLPHVKCKSTDIF